jgi:hypothetical protein
MRRYRPWVEAHISKRSVRIIDRLPAEFRRESILITLKSQLLPVLGRLKAVHRACSTATVENIVPRRPSPLSGLRNIWTRRAGHRWSLCSLNHLALPSAKRFFAPVAILAESNFNFGGAQGGRLPPVFSRQETGALYR